MNIFLPYEDNINKSVEVLDDKRLIKQILECYQLLQLVEKEKQNGDVLKGAGYHNHPIYKHYKQYENFLFLYGYTCCCEYEYRFDNHHRYFEYFEHEINSCKRAENYNYIPFYMEGSKGQPNYIRTTENVSQLYQRKLVHKWLNTYGGCTWTNRKKPEFLMEVVRNGERMIKRASEDKDYFYEIIWEVD